MSQTSSQQLEASTTFDQADAAWSATHGPHRSRKAVSVELPVNRLQVVDSEYDWHRASSTTQEGALLPRNVTFEQIVLSLLVPVARAICMGFDAGQHDDWFIVKVLLGETLWRTQSSMRHSTLAQVWYGGFGVNFSDCVFLLSHPICVGFVSPSFARDKKDARFEAAWSEACGDGKSVGHNSIAQFHGSINRLNDLSPFRNAADAFSSNAISFISAVSHVVLDEIVINCTSKMRFPASKKNAHGPEFFAAALPASRAGASAVVWLKPRLWRSEQGPTTFEIVENFLAAFTSAFSHLPVADRPVFVADSRFMTSAVVYKLLQDPMMPFVGTLNPAWYSEAVSHIKERATTILKGVLPADHTGSLTFTAGTKSLYDGRVFSCKRSVDKDDSTVSAAKAPSGSTSNTMKRSAPASATRKSARTSKRSVRLADAAADEDIDNELDMLFEEDLDNRRADDGAGLPKGALRNEPMWFLEYYTGLNEFRRQRPQYLLSNAIVGVSRAHSRARDPVAPLAGLFSACWRRVDQANKTVKENIMLHGVPSVHKLQENMLYFDYMWSNTLNTAFVFAADARGMRVQGDGPLYKFDQFGIEVAQLLQKIATVCQGRSERGEKVRALTFSKLQFD